MTNFLEIQFQLRGKTLPSDHGYALYSAVKRRVQNASEALALLGNIPNDVRLCSIAGIPDNNGMVHLHRGSRMRLRCPAEQVQLWYRIIQNQVLNIRGHLIRLVQPRLTLPQPSETLKARLVTFKLEAIDHPEVAYYFLESCKKGLERLEIDAQAAIDSTAEGDLARRTLQVKDKKILGYGIVVEGLSNEDSLKLQWHGLGGRQHFGCGWFYPAKEELDAA